MFKPNAVCQRSRIVGKDVYGQPQLSAPATEPCAVVKLDGRAMRTPVRGEVSASRGTAVEQEEVATLLFASNSTVTYDDMVTLQGIQLRVSSLTPQFTILGKVDHYEVGLTFWGNA